MLLPAHIPVILHCTFEEFISPILELLAMSPKRIYLFGGEGFEVP